MVRGNWQRRVELTASARQAYKLQKESRRNKSSQQRQHRSNSIAGEDSYNRLEQWLDENGDGILFGRRRSPSSGENDALEGDATKASTTTTSATTTTSNNSTSGRGAIITVDIWTQSPPTNRPEYHYLDDHYEVNYSDSRHDFNDTDDHHHNSRYKGGGGGRGSIKKKTKGKAHPNAKNKSSSSSNVEISEGLAGGSAGGGGGGGRDRSSSTSSQNNGKDYETNTNVLCAREFFFGKEKCKGTQQLLLAKKGGGGGGGRRGRSSSIGAEDDNNNTTDGCGRCCLRHYHQLPKNKHRKTLPSSKATSTLPPPSPPMTLAQVLNDKFYSPHHSSPKGSSDDDHGSSYNSKPTASLPVGVREAILKSLYDASSINNEDGNNVSSYIDMVYHTRFFVNDTVQSVSDNSKSTDDDDDDAAGGVDEKSLTRSKIHEALQRILNEYNIPSLTSIVYLTIQGLVIFDRYRGGLVITEKEERFLLFGEAIPVDTYLEETKKNLDNYDDSIDESSVPISERLTHNLLDEILAYSEDECAGILPRVCKSWREEIGSPQLWSMLLDRHGWPMRVNGVDDNENGGGGGGDEDEEGDDSLPPDDDILHQCEQLRETFISHYSVLRDVRALSNASTYIMAGGGSAGISISMRNNRLGLESAMHIFNPPNESAPSTYNIVKIWSEDKYKEGLSARALASYYDCTLRLFEVVRGNNDSTNAQGWGSSQSIKCRQVASLRVAPPTVSRKKGKFAIVGMDMDDDNVACLIGEHEQSWFTSASWMTVISRDDAVCAGNEGSLDDFIQSYDLRGAVIDFILSVTEGDIFLQELQGALHTYLSIFDGDTSAVEVSVRQELISCGRGIFLFSACTRIPRSALEEEEEEEEDSEYDRIFLFSVRTRSIVNSLHHEGGDAGVYLFASRPFKSRSVENNDEVLRSNILIEMPTLLQLVSVEIGRTGSTYIFNTAMIDRDEFAPAMMMGAVLTSSHAILSFLSTDGLFLHFHRLQSYEPNRIGIGGRECGVEDLFIIREHYVAVVIHDETNEQDEDELFDGEWLGLNEAALDERESFSIIVYHIPTAQEVCRCPLSLPAAAHSFDCIGDTLAMNVSNMGFVITGGNARDVGRVPMETVQTITSPSGKQPKGKKKRLVSLACGRKKDGFARGMSLRG